MTITAALLSDTSARSLVELSLSPFFVRRWPSLDAAVQDAQLDRTALQALFAAHVTVPPADNRRVIGVDASSLARPHSPTAADRTDVHVAHRPTEATPVTPGWPSSTGVVLPAPPRSWTYVLDNHRIPSHLTPAQVAATQVAGLIPVLPVRPLLLADGAYGSGPFWGATQGLACDTLRRRAKNRVLDRAAPPKTGKRGAPRKDGARGACHNPETPGTPDEPWGGVDAQGPPVAVACWHDLPFQAARQLPVSVRRVTRWGATNSPRDPRGRWCLCAGAAAPPLSPVALGDRRRYKQEHGDRVDKHDLLWAAPRRRTPEQFQHWTDLLAAVRTPVG